MTSVPETHLDGPAVGPDPGARPDEGDERGSGPRSVLIEERDFFLRSLRDLEAERAVGDLDDVDYVALKDDYTVRAAMVLRAIDALDHPASADLGDEDADSDENEGDATESTKPVATRPRRPRWQVAAVVGMLVAAAVVAGWAVARASGTRAPGEVISGQAVGDEAVAQLLAEAQQAVNKKDPVTALKDYQKILQDEPNNAEALSDEAWLLAQTQQSNLMTEGLTLLAQAETASPTYAPAHLYRGVILLDEGNAAAAIPELQFYLAHRARPHPGCGCAAGVGSSDAASRSDDNHVDPVRLTPSSDARRRRRMLHRQPTRPWARRRRAGCLGGRAGVPGAGDEPLLSVGARAESPQTADDSGQYPGCEVDLDVGGGPSDGEPQAALGGHSHGGQHGGWLQQLRRAGTSGVSRHPGLVEAEQDPFGLDAVDAQTHQIREPLRRIDRTISGDSRDAQRCGAQPVALGELEGRLFGHDGLGGGV